MATAGHVDHGKSTLVEALTGTDPDRFAEEKERGLTIDLGFADLELASGRGVAFIDVPGHVRFLKNMLAGVGGIDACLFVVSAVEGWKPQSEEHLRILDLLGLATGVIALTHADAVDDDTLELARLDVAEHVAGTFLEPARVVAVGAPTDLGLDELRAALDDLTAHTPRAADLGRPRLWVDRSFAAKGAGTVVTGTLTGGGLSAEDELLLLPADRVVRVRALQTLHRSIRSIGPGNRLAVNLANLDHRDVTRGDVLVRAGSWHTTVRVDATLQVLGSLPHAVSHRGAYAAYIGSGEHPVRLRVIGERRIEPGSAGLVRLHLRTALPLVPGDRYILRESGRRETVGGGEILDVDPRLPTTRAAPDRSVERVVAERGWVATDELARLTGVDVQPTLATWVVDPTALERARADLDRRIDEAGVIGLDLAVLDERERAVLDGLDGVTVDATRARRGATDPLADHPYVAELEGRPFSPPPPDGVDRAELRELVRRGAIVEADGILFAPGAIERAAGIVAGLLADRPDGVTVSEVREALGSTRKFVLPILLRLDATGVTRRRGDRRVGGPRLPTD